MMTPEEIDQLIGKKVAAAISAYAATQNSREGSQETTARDENHGRNIVQHQKKKQKLNETSDEGQNVKYIGKLPYCGSCDKHHTGYCTMICDQCKMIGHMTRDCRNATPIAKAIMAKNAGERCADGKGFLGNHPYCDKCDRHHPGQCTVIYGKCKKVGHKAKDCRIVAPIPITAVPMTCYECGAAGHFKRNCPKLRRQDAEPTEGRVYLITDGEDHQDLD